MNKNKRLTRLDRDIIKSMLDDKNNFTQISAAIGKDRTTVLERCSKNGVSFNYAEKLTYSEAFAEAISDNSPSIISSIIQSEVRRW